ncbi:MAG: rhodanese-like domain-containing protein [Humidesulfovibrio sp.]|nr:rhodanese-like domain-containing protein [Humidesulfovibrio sp.]
MKHPVLGVFLLGLLCLAQPAAAMESMSLDTFVREFDYETRKMMKCSGKELLSMLIKKEAVLVDIRFKEEQEAWGPSFALKIPLNELPARLSELPKDKIIVTACPHIDRSGIAMTYLSTKGYNAAYLVGGLVGLAELLRGDEARDFMAALKGQAPAKSKAK